MKLRFLVFILLLIIMLFSEAVHSEEIGGIYGETVSDGSTSHGIYYGLGYNTSSPNLLIGGIGQESQDPDLNSRYYRTVADNNQAIYVPTYYTGDNYMDAVEVNKAASFPQYDLTRTVLNGLVSPALNDKKYGTIIAYSGGTASVVTAMAEQEVTSDTLILISPMRGGGEVADWIPSHLDLKKGFEPSEDPNFADDDWANWFEQRIKTIMAQGTNIVIIQSERDNPAFGGLYKYWFNENEWPKNVWPRLTIDTVPLIMLDNDAHWEIFTSYATRIINGEYVPTTPEPASNMLPKDNFWLSMWNYLSNIPNRIAQTVWKDNTPPIVQAFSVSPPGLDLGDSFNIYYTVSDGWWGSGLKQAELWRKDENSDWQEIGRHKLSKDIDPISGTFTDSPSKPGKYWFGLHVVDDSDNRNDEKSSNTNNQPDNYRPIEVDVKSFYWMTNEYFDDSEATCTPGSVEAKCYAPDDCVNCDSSCVSSGTDLSEDWTCSDGKWKNRFYTRTNEYLDDSEATCTPGSVEAKCYAPDDCVNCDSSCVSSGTDLSEDWTCSDGKWKNRFYTRTNEYLDDSEATCTPGSVEAKCYAPDDCVNCDGSCVSSGTDLSEDWTCSDGKWTRLETNCIITAEAESWVEKGKMSYEQKQYREAIKCFDEALKICSQYEEAWFGKGDAYLAGSFGFFDENDPSEAILCYDEAIKINPRNKDAWNDKGTALIDLGKNDEAIQCYDMAIRIDSQYSEPWVGKSRAFYKMGDYAEALQCVNKAITMGPELPVYWGTKGDILKALGSDEAQSAFDRANELENIHKPTHEAKGAISYD